jgi:hypothetical protein
MQLTRWTRICNVTKVGANFEKIRFPKDLICIKVCCLAKGYALKAVSVTVTVTVTYCATRLLID